MAEFKCKQFALVGIGGTGCPCCNNLIGKRRKRLNRIARARMKIDNRKVVAESFAHDDNYTKHFNGM